MQLVSRANGEQNDHTTTINQPCGSQYVRGREERWEAILCQNAHFLI